MKKIFYLFLLMTFGVNYGFAQISQFNNLCTNNTDLTFTSDFNTKEFKTSSSSCQKEDSDYLKNINYYKVVSSGTFEFKYISSSLVNFHVWVLSENELNDFFNDNATKYNSERSSYSSLVNIEKGLFSSESDNCDYFDRFNPPNGKLAPLNVTSGQYVVIGFVTRDINARINYVTPGGTAIVCEPEPRPGDAELSGRCSNDAYSIAEVKDKVKSEIFADYGQTVDVSNIKIFSSRTSTNEITTDINSSAGLNQTYVAKIYNGSRVDYIYDVSVRFKPELSYTVQNKTEQYCDSSKNFTKDDLIFKISPTINSSKYNDYDVYVDDVKVNGSVILNNTQTYSLKLKYIGTEFCATNLFSNEVNLELENSNPTLDPGKFAEVCNSEILSGADILLVLGHGGTNYRLVNAPPSSYSFDSNGEFKFNVQIVDRNDNNCKSNVVEFTVVKKPNVLLNSLPNFVDCRSEFTLSDFRNKIDEIKNSDSLVSLTINYNGTNYTEAQLQSLYDLIISTTTQTDFNLSITGNKVGFCEVNTTFKIILNQSNIPTTTFSILSNSSCLEATDSYIFSVLEIERHIKAQLGNNIVIVDSNGNPLSAVEVLPNSSQSLSFKVRNSTLSSSCWSDLMTLELKTLNKPDVNDKTYSDKFCGGETLTINDNLLRNYFGNNVLNYQIKIDGNNYVVGTSIQKILNFNSNTSLNISIEVINNGCSKTVNLTINKKQDLIVDVVDIENNNLTNKIIYCEDKPQVAKTKIQNNLAYINSKYPTLVAKYTDEEIFAMFNSNDGFVEVVFEDPNYCGSVSVKLYYQKNSLPSIVVPSKELICTDQLYELDFTKQANYANYNYVVEKTDGSKVAGIDVFTLFAGTYKITIEDKTSSCSVVKTLVVENYPKPTITKIQINEKSIIVSAKGNGVLKYALFDENDNVLISYQTSNELKITDNITNFNFKVRVSSDDCAISDSQSVTYLSLPNVVTPNGDGINDVWKPKGIGDTTNTYRLIIFDRYGKQIYSKEGVNIIEWNGMQNGKPVAENTYWYVLTPINESNILQVQYSGSILVKRKTN